MRYLWMWQVCNSCGKRFYRNDEENCIECSSPMCPSCFADYDFSCCSTPRARRMQRAEISLIQHLYKLRTCRAVAEATKPTAG